jgi:hypothetical protein
LVTEWLAFWTAKLSGFFDGKAGEDVAGSQFDGMKGKLTIGH